MTSTGAPCTVDDLAELYVLALEKAPAGSYFLGASGTNPTVRSGEPLRRPGRTRRARTRRADARPARPGLLGEALLLDQQASGGTARRVLGRTPTGPSVLDDIARTDF
ncbi:hypothetical protein ACWGRK_16215 [Saccharomonospora azurea]